MFRQLVVSSAKLAQVMTVDMVPVHIKNMDLTSIHGRAGEGGVEQKFTYYCSSGKGSVVIYSR